MIPTPRVRVAHLLRAISFLVFAAIAGDVAVHAAPAKVVFLAGPKDHGRPGRHEYEKDLRTLAWCLEHSPNLPGVQTEVHVGRAPRDLEVFKGVAAIVIESSSDRSEEEIHPFFPADPLTNHHGYDDETTAWLKSLDELFKKQKTGVVILHYANWAENWAARGYHMTWVGGLWVQMVSRNPVDEWSMTPLAPEHAILRGVRPWTYRDEMFCRFHLPDDARRTNLLLGTPGEDKVSIGPQVASWACRRDDGGRGFDYGGVDWHENMKIEDYRRFLLNGITWAARLQVPKGGVDSPLPEGFQTKSE